MTAEAEVADYIERIPLLDDPNAGRGMKGIRAGGAEKVPPAIFMKELEEALKKIEKKDKKE